MEANITQVELANSMGITQGMVTQLEHLKFRMDITYVFDYLEGIGADPASFMIKFINSIEWKQNYRKEAV